MKATIVACGLCAAVIASSEAVPVRARLPSSSPRAPCDSTAEDLLTVRSAQRAVGPGQPEARLALVLRGRSLANATADFCMTIGGKAAYRDAWSTQWWAEPWVEAARQRGNTVHPDSVISVQVNRFFSEEAFRHTRFTEEYLEDPLYFYRPLGYSLKQYAYREKRRLPVAMSFPQTRDEKVIPHVTLPRQVRDSLDRAPLDSSLVRTVVQRLLQEKAMTFTYHLGGELVIEIVWDRVSRRFLAVAW